MLLRILGELIHFLSVAPYVWRWDVSWSSIYRRLISSKGLQLQSNESGFSYFWKLRTTSFVRGLVREWCEDWWDLVQESNKTELWIICQSGREKIAVFSWVINYPSPSTSSHSISSSTLLQIPHTLNLSVTFLCQFIKVCLFSVFSITGLDDGQISTHRSWRSAITMQCWSRNCFLLFFQTLWR